MNRETLFAMAVMVVLLGPAAYWIWRWMADLVRGRVRRGACCGCVAKPTDGCAAAGSWGCTLAGVRASDPATVRETVLYVSDLTEANAARFRAALLALDGVEAAIARSATGTMRVIYRPARLVPGDLVSALEGACWREKVEREEKPPAA